MITTEQFAATLKNYRKAGKSFSEFSAEISRLGGKWNPDGSPKNPEAGENASLKSYIDIKRNAIRRAFVKKVTERHTNPENGQFDEAGFEREMAAVDERLFFEDEPVSKRGRKAGAEINVDDFLA